PKWAAAEEVAEPGRLDDADQGAGAEYGRAEDERTASAGDDGLAELRADERSERHGSGAPWGAGEAGNAPCRCRGECCRACSDRDLDCEFVSKRRIGTGVEERLGGQVARLAESDGEGGGHVGEQVHEQQLTCVDRGRAGERGTEQGEAELTEVAANE